VEHQKHKFTFPIDKNSLVDDGEGVVSFSKPLTITDNSEQRNGTRYDIKTMDLSEYDGMLTADHSSSITEIIGETFGITKGRTKVTISGIRFAIKESALAQFAYNMLKGGFLKNFSIETFGPYPDDDGVYHEAKLVGLSAVVIGNNRSAAVNQIALNSLEEAKKQGIDPTNLENIIKNNMEEKKPVVETPKETPTPETPAPVENSIEKTLEKLLSPITAKLEALEKNQFDKGAKEPKFTPAVKKVENAFNSMDYRERHGKQINLAWDYLKSKNDAAGKQLRELNAFHVQELQKAGIVQNSMTIADFGNFVVSPELLTDIEGHRSNFSALLSVVPFRETLSLQMSWLKRDGDIDMSEVEMCDDGADGNLKPISDYDASIQTSNLHELAAVTPVCNAATRFLAADMLQDIAAGYRTDYDRKRAQLFIARLQQAVDETGNTTAFATTTDTNSLKAVIDGIGPVAETVMNGTWIMNHSTYWRLMKSLVGAGISGPLGNLFTTGDQASFAGRPYIVVPNELLPTIDTGNTNRTFTVEGTSVTIDQAMFYVDPSVFSGRTSGGLNYDLSTEAAYEVSGTVKSAYQRNELVLRGSFFRGGAVRDVDKVAGVSAPGVS
jgi:HK97 family phage major capsid protein